jgi:integrase
MITKEYLLVPLFEKFIKDTKTGKRLSKQGKKIKDGTITNYNYVLNYLKLYEQTSGKQIRIRAAEKMNQKELLAEKKYWNKFYIDFTGMLYKKNCFDNYVGMLIKNLRVFFIYMHDSMGINPGPFYKSFYVISKDIDIIVLIPERLKRLIHDKEFENSLSDSLRVYKDILVMGCTVALRFGDLNTLKWDQLSYFNGSTYLDVKSEKTDTATKIKLPDYVLEILERYKTTKSKNKRIFPYVSIAWFDKSLKRIMELAGWTEVIGKSRTVRGISQQITIGQQKKPYRFCDLAASHLMRRTAITTMLMHGVPDSVVKQISGHAGDSRSFNRYIALVQSYMDMEIDNHFKKMQL